jgi:hypothetical protein
MVNIAADVWAHAESDLERVAVRSLRHLLRARPHIPRRSVTRSKDMKIPNLVTDPMANEVTVDPKSGVILPLHSALMHNRAVTFTETAGWTTWPLRVPRTDGGT